MLNIEIKGVQFSNKGAELMLEAILEQLDDQLDNYEITLSPGPNLPYIKRAKLGAWQKLSFRRGSFDLTGSFGKLPNIVKRLLKRYGIVTESEIDVILNASGFAYGDQWPAFDLKNTAKEIIRFKKANKPYIILPQAIGPFNNLHLQKDASILINDSCLIFARDEQSFLACKKLDKSNNLQISPDFTALVASSFTAKFPEKTICLIPNNKVVSKYNHIDAEQEYQSYVMFWVRSAEVLIKLGYKVALLNHEGKEDLAICEDIIKHAKCELILIDGLSGVKIKAFLGQCDGVISSRYHGCVSALTQGVPCLATSWSHKYEMLYQEYDLPNNIVNFQLSEADLRCRLNQFIACLPEQSDKCLAHAEKVKSENKLMWSSVINAIKK
ncbi:polysaccharide pyruvyl transferase family protein [Pseudoalteromonas tunicata]|uniref:polysaccharide pyruvyl transferase family protein n=1 Tax=Pseudoalteromonas tunicata TaxID=314281 RepID=UPI00273FC61F|nr:polysaccharide pyruvyl transferase family protein [Pseudoalteromonas tunicata]MDP4982700.1 polysaccharide pyruvyl transferase family protein [Pseudoalteromonas tunicata]